MIALWRREMFVDGAVAPQRRRSPIPSWFSILRLGNAQRVRVGRIHCITRREEREIVAFRNIDRIEDQEQERGEQLERGEMGDALVLALAKLT